MCDSKRQRNKHPSMRNTRKHVHTHDTRSERGAVIDALLHALLVERNMWRMWRSVMWMFWRWLKVERCCFLCVVKKELIDIVPRPNQWQSEIILYVEVCVICAVLHFCVRITVSGWVWCRFLFPCSYLSEWIQNETDVVCILSLYFVFYFYLFIYLIIFFLFIIITFLKGAIH